MNSLPLFPSKRCFIFDVICNLCIMSKLILIMLSEAQFVFVINKIFVPRHSLFFPVLVPFLHFIGVSKPLQIPLLKFSLSEKEMSRCNLISEGFSDLCNSKRNFHAHGLSHILIIQIDSLARFSLQICSSLFSVY